MFVLVNQVGNNFGILDTDVGILDWVQIHDLDMIVAFGTEIKGYKNGVVNPVKFILNFTKCNWLKDNKNIFRFGNSFQRVNKNEFKIRAENKEFKGKIIKEDDYLVRLQFNNGIISDVPLAILKKLKK